MLRLRGKGSGCSRRRECTSASIYFYFGHGSMVRTTKELCVLVLAVLPFFSPFDAFSHESREPDELWCFADGDVDTQSRRCASC